MTPQHTAEELEDDGSECTRCCGDGYIEGDDPLWDEGEFIRCPSCNGSGKRKDMTVW